MKVLFPLLWIAGHAGDNAIWKKIIKVIELASPGSEYICPVQVDPADSVTLRWDIDQLTEVSPNIRVVPIATVSGFDQDKFRYLTTKEQVMDYMEQVKPLPVLEEADILISQGGGYMFNDACYDLYLPPFYVAQKLNKPTIFNTQTFTGSDFTKATKILGNLVFNKAKHIFPREQKSSDILCREFGLTRESTVSPDFTFDLIPEPYEKDLPGESIKFNLRTDVNNEAHVAKIARVADMVVETLGPVVFVPICHGGDRDDRILHDKIASSMCHDSVCVRDELTAGQAMTIMSNGLTITDRYHTAIFSAASNTPFVPLAPDIDFKMAGLLDLLAYPFDVLDLTQISSEDLFRRILKAWEQREKTAHELSVVTPRIKQRVSDCTNQLCKLLKEQN